MPKHNQKGVPSLIEEVKAKQRNIVWPDPIRNSRTVDAFLWRGSPNATTVQRIGAGIFGLFFLSIGIATVVLAYERQSLIHLLVGLFSCVVGIRVTSNAFRRSE